MPVPFAFGSIHCAERALVIAATLFETLAGSAAAQAVNPSPPGYKEYIAILGTPIGSLAPFATYTLARLAQRSPELVARYGFVEDMALPLAPASGGHDAHSLGSVGLTGVIPVDLGGTVSLTLGLSNEQCSGCSGTRFMGSLAGDYRILSAAVDALSATRFTLAVKGEVGAGRPATGTTWTADIGFPLAFTVGPESGTQLIPFVTPSLALVTTSGSSRPDAISSLRMLLGGGVSLFNAKSALGANAGISYIFVPKTQVGLGVGLSYGGR